MADRPQRQLTCLPDTRTPRWLSVPCVLCLLTLGSLTRPSNAQQTPTPSTKHTNPSAAPSSPNDRHILSKTSDRAEQAKLSITGARVVFDPVPRPLPENDAVTGTDRPQADLPVSSAAAWPDAPSTPSVSLTQPSLPTSSASAAIDDLIDTILSHDDITSAALSQDGLTMGDAFSLENDPPTSHPLAQSETRIDRWSRSVFADDAALLTPFARGSEMISWNLSEAITLAGVGSRRVWDPRDRAFVLSAEAGFTLSPETGFQVGYQLLQTSLNEGVVMPDLSRDSLFARFQLRF